MDDPSLTPLVIGVVAAAIPTTIGWLALRVVRGYDSKLSTIDSKLDGMVSADTSRQVELADLRVRVVHLEHVVHGRGLQGQGPLLGRGGGGG